jgi:hypothetical protein
MKNQQLKRNMRNQIRALFIAVSFTLASTGASHAKSDLISLSKDPVWPTTPTPANNVLYNVSTVGRGGSGLLLVTLTAGNLPPGVTATFSPSVLKFTGNAATLQTSTMTMSCAALTATDCFAFTITATDQRGDSITITNQVTFTPNFVASRPATLLYDPPTNGIMNLRGLGAGGQTYNVVASPTLIPAVWTPVSTSIADGNGRFYVPPQMTTVYPVRFFRTVSN